MTGDEKQEIRQLITDLLTVNHAKTESALDVLHYKMDTQENLLSEIKQQVTRTNGRVTELEKKSETHYVSCPHAPEINKKVRAIEDNMLSTRAVKAWILGSVAVTGTIIGIVFIIVKLYLGA